MRDAVKSSMIRVCAAVALVVVIVLALLAPFALISHLRVVNVSDRDLTDVQVVIATLSSGRVRETHSHPVLRAGEAMNIWNWRGDSSVRVTWVANGKKSEFIDYCADGVPQWTIRLRDDGGASRR